MSRYCGARQQHRRADRYAHWPRSRSRGEYSLYTGTLVTLMRQPGADMEKIVKNTRLEVRKKSGSAQSPWMISALDGDVRLFDAPNQDVGEKLPVQEKSQVQIRRSRDFDPGRAGAGLCGIS
jgi:hypothetical protein